MPNEDLTKYSQYDAEDTEKYKDNTAFKVQEVELTDRNFLGTFKITEKLAKQASLALKERIEATEDYTRARIERINRNYDLVEMQTKLDTSEQDSQDSEIFNAAQDWVDDLYLIFSNFIDTINVTENGDSLNEFIPKVLEIKEFEERQGQSALLALLKKLKGKQDKTDTYYFKKLEAIKQLLKDGLQRSGFDKKIEGFLLSGVVSGMFVFKEGWDVKVNYKLVKEDSKYTTNSENYYCYQFKPKDPRNLIFRKDKFDWVIELVDGITYSSLLNETLDADGKPLPIEEAIYDYDMLKKVEDCLKEKSRDSNVDQETKIRINDDDDLFDVYEIDGDLKIFEGHHIPLYIDGQSVLCIISAVKINNEYIPIGIRKTWCVKNPYKMTNMFFKDNDIAGYGIPELLEKYEKIINTLQNYSLDNIDMSIKGVTLGDRSYFEDPSQLDGIEPGTHLDMKNITGVRIDDVFKWLNGNIQALPYSLQMLDRVKDTLIKTSRKGPSGAKTTPNPSATEFSKIANELEKSVNRCAVRLNLLFQEMLENMYKYTLLNRTDDISLKVQAYRLKNLAKNTEDIENVESGGDGSTDNKFNDLLENAFIQIDRYAGFSLEELFIDDIGFEITAIEKADRQALEKQQAMQFYNILQSGGYLMPIPDPTTGTTTKRVINDDGGTAYQVDEYRVLVDLGRKLGQKNFLMRLNNNFQSDPLLTNNMPRGSKSPLPVAPNTPNLPPLNAQPTEGDLLAGAAQV